MGAAARRFWSSFLLQHADTDKIPVRDGVQHAFPRAAQQTALRDHLFACQRTGTTGPNLHRFSSFASDLLLLSPNQLGAYLQAREPTSSEGGKGVVDRQRREHARLCLDAVR